MGELSFALVKIFDVKIVGRSVLLERDVQFFGLLQMGEPVLLAFGEGVSWHKMLPDDESRGVWGRSILRGSTWKYWRLP